MEKNDKEKWDILSLANKLEKCVERLRPKQRFIHPNSVYNFIFHFNSFKDKRIKQHVYDNLFQMLEVLQNTSVDELNPELGASLYDRYLQPLLHYYNVKQKFFININWKYLLAFQTAIFLFLIFSEASIIINLIVLSMFVILFAYKEKKRKQRRLYGVYF